MNDVEQQIIDERIHAQYVLVNGLFDHFEPLIKVDIKRSRYRHSAHALYYAAKKLDAQLTILFKSNNEANYYVNQILFRTIFEHYLIAYYIGTKCRAEGLDTAGIDYYGAYGQKELIKRAFKAYDIEMVRDKKPKLNEAQRIERFNRDHQNHYHPMTEQEKRLIYEKSSQFNEERIIKYLIHDAPQDYFVGINQSLHGLLSTYNVVSSNIHGGPSSEIENFHKPGSSMMIRLNSMHLNICKYCSFGVKLSLFYTLNRNSNMKEYEVVFTVLENLIKSLGMPTTVHNIQVMAHQSDHHKNKKDRNQLKIN